MIIIIDLRIRIDDIRISNIDKILDKDGVDIIIPNSWKFDNNAYGAYMTQLSQGEYYFKKVIDWKKGYNTDELKRFCFTNNFLNKYDLEYSILDKNFVCECADKKISDICGFDFEKPLKKLDEYYEKGYVPMYLQNGKIKKHYNVYFSYTKELYLDDVRVEFLYEEAIDD